MKNTNNHGSNFWFGFALGTIGATAVGYLLGTQNGREILKKLITYAEEFENDPQKLNEFINSLKNIKKETHIGENASETMPKVINTLSTVLDRVKDMTQDTKKPKQFFIKNNKNSSSTK